MDELKTFLTDNGAAPCGMFNDRNLLNYLACIPFNNFLYSLKLTRVNIFLSDEEMHFVDFILKLRKIRNHKQNFLLDAPPTVLHYDSPLLGRRDNPRYEEEMEHYRTKLEEYEHRKEMREKQREELLQSPEAEVFHFVEKELRSALCSRCDGIGWCQPDEAGSVDIQCSWCMGTGRSGYTPSVSPDQRRAAEAFRVKLDSLEDPVFASFPLRKKTVFIRLTYDGQLFIK